MINRELVLAKLKEALPFLKQEYHITSMEIFGSVARGEDSPNDVDILVMHDDEFTAYDWGGLYTELEALLGCSVDIALKNNMSEKFANNIADDLIAV